MTEPSIQLWTDDSGNEFAISLISNSNPHFVIKTNEKASYTKKVDESVCMQGYTYDWKHTLSEWVHFHYGNEVVLNIPISNHHTTEPEEIRIKSHLKPVRYHMKYFKSSKPREPVSKTRVVLNRGVLKCHFCNLKYVMEEDRREHERFWHYEQPSKK